MTDPGSTTAVTATVPLALGPDSLAWKHAGDNLQLLMAGTTLMLQVSHPVVGAGVEQYSVFKTDPWGRLQRTTEWGLRLLYGGPEKAPQAGRDLRDLHRDIKGTDDKGRRYFTLDPEAYAWVHMTTYYALVTTQRLFAEKPFTPAQEARLYQEWLQQGRVLGIRDQDMPQDLPAFWLYFNDMVENRLEVTSLARYLLDVSLRRAKKPPTLKWLPDFLWNGLYGSVGNWARLNTIATLPQALRDKYELVWDQPAQRRFRRLQKLVQWSLPLLPLKARYMPPAAKALRQTKSSGQQEHGRIDLAA